MQQAGKIIIITGIIVVVIGLIIYFLGDKLSWIGRLPGDIRIEKEHFRFYIPLTTTILISLLLTLIIYLIRKIF